MIEAQPYWNATVPELSVTNFERSLHFYNALCGFAVRFQRADPAFAYLELGQVQLMIEACHAGGWYTGELVAPLGRGVNLQLEVNDLQAIESRLHAAGYALFRPARDTWYATGPNVQEGQRELLVQDPDGYLLRFARYLGQRTSD